MEVSHPEADEAPMRYVMSVSLPETSTPFTAVQAGNALMLELQRAYVAS